MSDIWSYPKVYNLGHPQLDSLLDGPVAVQEKVDGSQFSFGVLDGVLKMRSKGQELFVESADKMFRPAVDTVLRAASKLKPGWVYRCETLCKPTHNALSYERVPTGNLVLFDVELEPDRFLAPWDLEVTARALDIEAVPLFLAGEFDFAASEEYLQRPSFLGGPFIEGFVIKNYARFGRDGKVLMGKHVQEKFREVHKSKWGESNPGGSDIIERIGDTLRTDARWMKAVQHLRERGELELDPRDIGKLIVEAKADVFEENQEDIVRQLLDWAKPKLLRKATAGLPEWYKEQLRRRQFGEGPLASEPDAIEDIARRYAERMDV